MTQAIISRNPQAKFYNEVELVDTFDFTYSVQALKVMLMVAKQIKADPRPTDRELMGAIDN